MPYKQSNTNDISGTFSFSKQRDCKFMNYFRIHLSHFGNSASYYLFIIIYKNRFAHFYRNFMGWIVNNSMVFRLGLGWFRKNQLEVLKKYLKQTQASEGDFNYLNTNKRFFPKSLENAFVIYEVSLDCNRTIFKDYFFSHYLVVTFC